MTEENTDLSATSVLKELKPIGNKAVLPAVFNRYSKEQLSEVIEKNYGIITQICSQIDCTARQLYIAIDKYELRDILKQAKQQLVGLAEKAIVECLNSENEGIKLKAAETTLKSLGKEEWSQAPNIAIQQAIISDDKKRIEIRNIFGLGNQDDKSA